jgi:uncharacterized protein involved in exopolysaccharide biosynthesis
MADTYTGRTLREVIRVVASRFLGMVIIFAAVVAAVWVATDYAPKEYRSEVPLLAEPEQPIELLPRPAASSLREKIALFVDTQREIIMSDYVLASALLRLEGKEPTGALPETSPAETPIGALGPRVEPTVDQKGPEIKDEGFREWDEAVEKYKTEHGDYLEKARKRIMVITPGGPDAAFTQIFKIRVDWPEERELAAQANLNSTKMAADRARKIAMHVLDAYRQRYTELERRRAKEEARGYEGISLEVAQTDIDTALRKRREFIEGLEPEIKSNLLYMINVVGDSGLETGIASTIRETKAEVEKIAAEEKELTFYMESTLTPQTAKVKELAPLEAEFDAVEGKIAENNAAGAEEELKGIVDRIRSFSLVVPDDASATSSSLRGIQDRATLLRLKLDELTTNYKYMHEAVRNAARELLNVWKTLGRDMEDQATKIREKIGKLRTGRKSKEDWLFGDGVARKGKEEVLAKLVTASLEYDHLNSRVKAAAETYNKALEKRIEAETRRRLAQSPILASIMDSPSRPDPNDPRRPILWLNVLIAGIAGLVLSLIYAFMADHFDHTIKGIDDAERYLGTPVLASIPKLGFRIVRTRRRQ